MKNIYRISAHLTSRTTFEADLKRGKTRIEPGDCLAIETDLLVMGVDLHAALAQVRSHLSSGARSAGYPAMHVSHCYFDARKAEYVGPLLEIERPALHAVPDAPEAS